MRARRVLPAGGAALLAGALAAGGLVAARTLTGSGAERASPARAASWLAARYQIPVEFAGLPTETAAAIACTFARAAVDYPDVAASVRWIGSFQGFVARYHLAPQTSIGPNVWAFASSAETAARLDADPAIVLSANAGRHAAAFARNVAGSIRAGLHPPGHEGIEGALLHEFGHHVWWVLRQNPAGATDMRAALGRALGSPVDLDGAIPAGLRPRIASALSRHAASGWDEFMAEAFVEWYNAPGSPRPLASAAGRVFDRYLRRPAPQGAVQAPEGAASPCPG